MRRPFISSTNLQDPCPSQPCPASRDTSNGSVTRPQRSQPPHSFADGPSRLPSGWRCGIRTNYYLGHCGRTVAAASDPTLRLSRGTTAQPGAGWMDGLMLRVASTTSAGGGQGALPGTRGRLRLCRQPDQRQTAGKNGLGCTRPGQAWRARRTGGMDQQAFPRCSGPGAPSASAAAPGQ